MPAASGMQAMSELGPAEHQGLIHAFSDIGYDIDTLIIDTAAGISDAVTSFCKAAHEVVVVLNDEPASLADSYALIKVLNRDHGVDRFRVLANNVESDQDGFQHYTHLLAVAERFLDVNLDYMGSIPSDPYQRKANRRQSLISEVYPRSKASRAWTRIAENVDAWSVEYAASGKLEFFIERLLTPETVLEVAR